MHQFRISWLNVSLIEWRWFAWTSSFIKSDKVKSAISHKNKAYFLLLLHNDSPSSSHNTLNNALSIGKLFLCLSTRRTLTYSSWLSNYTMIMNALIISVMMQIRQLEGILVCCAPSGSCWLLLRTLEARGSKLEDKTRQDNWTVVNANRSNLVTVIALYSPPRFPPSASSTTPVKSMPQHLYWWLKTLVSGDCGGQAEDDCSARPSIARDECCGQNRNSDTMAKGYCPFSGLWDGINYQFYWGTIDANAILWICCWKWCYFSV